MKKHRLRGIVDFEEMRRHKLKTAVYLVLRAVTTVVAVISTVSGEWESAMTCLLTLALMMIPSFLDRRMRITLPTAIEIIMVSFVFAANILG